MAKLAFTFRGPEAEASRALEMLFTSKWLDSVAENDEKGRTNRQIQAEVRCVLYLCFFFPKKISPLRFHAKKITSPSLFLKKYRKFQSV
jgi:hypothetical protein